MPGCEILITGGGGQLARGLLQRLQQRAVGLTREQLDVTDVGRLTSTLADWRPRVIINAAGYTAVDRAESEPEKCEQVNVTAVEALATYCREHDCRLVHISTDYVFHGTPPRDRALREDEPPNPRGVYATTKYHGELAAARAADHLIVRTCGLYGGPLEDQNFVNTILRLSAVREQLHIVDDQWCTPSSLDDVIRGLEYLVDAGATGIVHLVNSGRTTWYRFTCELVRLAGLPVRVLPISTEEYGAAAPRPLFSVLDTTRYRELGGPALPDWSIALQNHLRRSGLLRA